MERSTRHKLRVLSPVHLFVCFPPQQVACGEVAVHHAAVVQRGHRLPRLRRHLLKLSLGKSRDQRLERNARNLQDGDEDVFITPYFLIRNS